MPDYLSNLCHFGNNVFNVNKILTDEKLRVNFVKKIRKIVEFCLILVELIVCPS